VVAIIVTYYTGGATANFFAGALGQAAGAAATAAVAAVAGSVASQAFATAIGEQDKFSFSAVARAGLLAAIPGVSFGDGLLAQAASGAVNNAIGQGALLVLNLQKKFDWGAVAGAAAGAAAGGASDAASKRVFSATKSTFAAQYAGQVVQGLASDVVYGQLTGRNTKFKQLAVDSFGGALKATLGGGPKYTIDLSSLVPGSGKRTPTIDDFIQPIPVQLEPPPPPDTEPPTIEVEGGDAVALIEDLSYQANIEALEARRIEAPRNKAEAIKNGLIEVGSTAFSYGEALANSFNGNFSQGFAVAQVNAAISGDEKYAALLELAGESPDSLARFETLEEKQIALLNGFDKAAQASLSIVTGPTSPASRRVVELLATDFQGLGDLSFVDKVARSTIPFYAYDTAKTIDAEIGAVGLLRDLHVFDAESSEALLSGLEVARRNNTEYEAVGPFFKEALDLYVSPAEATPVGGAKRYGGGLGPVQNTLAAVQIAAAFRARGSTVFKGIVKGEVFKFADVRVRGRRSEAFTLKQVFSSTDDPGSIKVIDRVARSGRTVTGTSLKSIDLTADYAQDALKLEEKLTEYVSALRNFKGEPQTYKGKVFDSTGLNDRELALTVGRQVPTSSQLDVIERVAAAAARGRNKVAVSVFAAR
jgi:hypothetical protein